MFVGKCWACPTCSMARGDPYIVNTAPRVGCGTQGEDHLNGKKHMKARMKLMDEVFTKTRVIDFLKDIDAFIPAG